MASYQAVSILRGGPNTQLRETMAQLEALGHEVTLFDPWKPFTKNDADIFHIFAANIGTYHLAREIRDLKIPLVITPIIYSNHSAGYVRRVLNLSKLMRRAGRGLWSDYLMTADICSWSARVLPNTAAETDLVVNGLGVPRAKTAVIPNGVDERFGKGDPSLFEKKYGIKEFILNVGHIGHERKNVLTLIRALGQIDHPSVIIGRIINNEYGRACLQEAAKFKQILLIDGLDNSSDMLASAYAAADVFVLPSLFETPGIAALEAGLAGAKIVITPRGGTREYFKDMALYVNPASIDSIQEGIIKALTSRKDDRLRSHIKKEFLWQRVAEKTAAEYIKAAGTGITT